MKNTKLTIFIPTGERSKSLEKVLLSLKNQTYKNFEVIVVDFKEDLKNKKLCYRFEKNLKIKYLIQNKKGICNAANLALKNTNSDYFTRTDDDVLIPKNWVKNIVNTFSKNKKIGAVTGPTIIPKKNIQSRDLFYFENKFKNGNIFFKILGKIYFNYFLENNPYRVAHWFKCGAFSLGSNFENAKKIKSEIVTNLEACNFTVKTKLLKKIGGFDESFTGACEYNEADISFKTRNKGYQIIYKGNCWLNHIPSTSGFFKKRPESFSRMINFIKFYFRHIKPNNLDKFFRFFFYLIFLNLYYLNQAVSKKQTNQLGAIGGTFWGILINLPEL